ncbi:hypothetical protein HK102_000387 [Quaeritorhiza haematococci]|nr:hypothetical protein HK102_000387 [Quaeritorhiza haematococci]
MDIRNRDFFPARTAGMTKGGKVFTLLPLFSEGDRCISVNGSTGLRGIGGVMNSLPGGMRVSMKEERRQWENDDSRPYQQYEAFGKFGERQRRWLWMQVLDFAKAGMFDRALDKTTGIVKTRRTFGSFATYDGASINLTFLEGTYKTDAQLLEDKLRPTADMKKGEKEVAMRTWRAFQDKRRKDEEKQRIAKIQRAIEKGAPAWGCDPGERTMFTMVDGSRFSTSSALPSSSLPAPPSSPPPTLSVPSLSTLDSSSAGPPSSPPPASSVPSLSTLDSSSAGPPFSHPLDLLGSPSPLSASSKTDMKMGIVELMVAKTREAMGMGLAALERMRQDGEGEDLQGTELVKITKAWEASIERMETEGKTLARIDVDIPTSATSPHRIRSSGREEYYERGEPSTRDTHQVDERQP